MQEQKFHAVKPIIFIIMGAFGVVLGIIGIFAGFQSQQKIKKLESEITQNRDLEIEHLELKKFVMSLEERMDKIGTDVVKNRESFESTFIQVDKVLENVSNFLNKMNNSGSKRVIAQKTEGASPSHLAEAPGKNDSTSNRTSDKISQGKLENGFHIISSGDTYEKLARIYKVKVQDIIIANPDVNPRKLQLGQKIKVPE